MTSRLLPTALVLAFAATLFTLGGIAFLGLDANRYVDESSTVQAKIREEAIRRSIQQQDSLVTDSGGAAARCGFAQRKRRMNPAGYSTVTAGVGSTPTRTPESVASESIALVASAPEYTAYVVTGIGRTCIGEHDLIRPLLSGQRCPGTTYAPPSTIYVAVWSSRQSQRRCVCINFGDPPTKTRFYGEHRTNPDLTEWLLLPVPSSVRWLRDGSPSPDRFIEVKAFPLSRGCWSCTALGEGEVLLSRVDINLLPQIGWGGGVWP